MTVRSLVLLGSALGLALNAPLAAQTAAGAETAATATAGAIAQFVPRPAGAPTSIDYTFLDDALQFMVMTMGPSTRQGERRPDATLGTRQRYGHESRVRLESNRVVFSFLEDEQIAPLTEYRKDLERLGTELDIASLPRNEQLAYWINLHNVAVIEQIAVNYPMSSPSRLKLGANGTPLDITPVITVAGVPLSPRDIRTRIVFPNWDNPDVIYGFFRGEVGGPSIQRRAYKADEVESLLQFSANEFVNSLRGVEAFGENLLVSKIYEEAAPFYFPDMADDLRAHLLTHAQDEVEGLIGRKDGVRVNQYEETVADLAAGDREPTYNTVTSDGIARGFRITPSISRFLGERFEKFEKLRREGLLRGRVIVLPPGGDGTEQAVPTGDVIIPERADDGE